MTDDLSVERLWGRGDISHTRRGDGAVVVCGRCERVRGADVADVAAYDDIAEWYDAQVRGGGLLHEMALPALFALVGDVRGQRLCDLACGQGVVARQLAARGARVIGVDLSARLLAIARRDEEAEALGIAYLCGDAQRLDVVGDGRFDGVVCNMALMDIADLAATARTVVRILRPDGWFVFVITHPLLDTALGREGVVRGSDGVSRRATRTYFAEGAWRSTNPDGVRGKVDAHHRTFGTYLNTLSEAGLRFERLLEPRPTDGLAERSPHLCDVPGILAARWRVAGRES